MRKIEIEERLGNLFLKFLIEDREITERRRKEFNQIYFNLKKEDLKNE